MFLDLFSEYLKSIRNIDEVSSCCTIFEKNKIVYTLLPWVNKFCMYFFGDIFFASGHPDDFSNRIFCLASTSADDDLPKVCFKFIVDREAFENNFLFSKYFCRWWSSQSLLLNLSLVARQRLSPISSTWFHCTFHFLSLSLKLWNVFKAVNRPGSY